MMAAISDLAGNLHSALNLLVDSAIAADDAISENDSDRLTIAVDTIQRNTNTVLGLYHSWGTSHV